MSGIADETLDLIFSFIDNREDLRSSILTSRRFASILEPHIQYHTISCTLCTTDLWEHLSENAVLAQNVRTLEIQRQHQYLMTTFKAPIVPRDFIAHAHDPANRKFYSQLPVEDLPRLREAERALIRAIKNMSNLKSFKWERCVPLLDSRLDKDVPDDIWTVLATACPALENLWVTDASEDQLHEGYEHIRPIHHSLIWKLPQSFKSFRYHTYAYRHVAGPVPVEELTALLRRCPNLEDFSLGFTLHGVQETEEFEDVSTANLNELLANIYWPKLHTLRTFAVHVSSSTAAKFFEAHPTLSTLQIIEATSQAKFIKDETFEHDAWPIKDPELTLYPGSLPNLKNVKVPEYVAIAIKRAQRLYWLSNMY